MHSNIWSTGAVGWATTASGIHVCYTAPQHWDILRQSLGRIREDLELESNRMKTSHHMVGSSGCAN